MAVLALAAGALAAGRAALAPTLVPAGQPPGGPGQEVRAYHFTIDLPDSGGEIRGSAAIVLVRTGRGGDTLRLDLTGMRVAGAWDHATSR